MFQDKTKKWTGREYPWWWDWNLFWWRFEGIAPLNGLNIYHPQDESSIGFSINAGRYEFRCRYSKRTKKFFVGFHKYTFMEIK